MTVTANASPSSPPAAASIAMLRWKMRAICKSVPPSMWTTSIVSRWPLSAVRAASSTAAEVVAASSPTSASASQPSASTAPNTGSSQPAWASTRALGATLASRARSSARRASLTGPSSRASIRAGIGRASASLLPEPARVPSHGSIRASTSAAGTSRTEATPGASRSAASASLAWAERSAGAAETTWTVIPPARSALACPARLVSARPPAAATTVSSTMIAMTHGIGPERRVCGTSCASDAPEIASLTVRSRAMMARGRVGGALIVCQPPTPLGPAAADSAARRSDRTIGPDRAA